MSAYVIVDIEITDPVGYEQYRKIAYPVIADFGGKYLVNPMFIAPKAQLGSGYPCSTTACVNDKGAAVPCYDEGTPPTLIPDQQDKVFTM